MGDGAGDGGGAISWRLTKELLRRCRALNSTRHLMRDILLTIGWRNRLLYRSSGKTGRYLTARPKAITPKLTRVMVTTISIHEGK